MIAPRPPGTWRDIDGFPGYQVSADGGVWSVRSCKLLKPLRHRDGHLRVNLRRDGRAHKRFIHRLVLEAFAGPRARRAVARHLNGDPTDNHLSNLAWGSQRENVDDRSRHGRTAKGERNGRAKLTAGQVRTIRKRAKAGDPVRSLAREFGLDNRSVRDIVQRVNWKHIA